MTESPIFHVLSALIASSPSDATSPVLEIFVEILYQDPNFFFHACNDSYPVRSSCFIYFHLYNLTSVGKTEGFSLSFVSL